MRDTASGECVPCPKGTYNTKPYSTSCIPCPEGTTTFLEGANAAYICQGRKTTVLKWLLEIDLHTYLSKLPTLEQMHSELNMFLFFLQ